MHVKSARNCLANGDDRQKEVEVVDDIQLLIFSFELSFVGLCFLKFFILFIYLAVAGLSCGTWIFHAWLPSCDTWAPQLWHTGLVALWHMGS